MSSRPTLDTRRVVLFNSNAGSVDAELTNELENYCREQGVSLVKTASKDDAMRRAERSAESGAETVVAAGGDGTIAAVLAGLQRAARPATMAVLPLGTGNDFARALNLPLGTLDGLSALSDGRRFAMDVLRVTDDQGTTSYGVNCLNCGTVPRLTAAVSKELKQSFGAIAFLKHLPATLDQVRAQPVLLQLDDDPSLELMLSALVVANAPMVGGGRTVAPVADPTDGVLDVLMVAGESAVDLARVAVASESGALLEHELVQYANARQVVLSLPDEWGVNLDGDPVSGKRLTVDLLPGAQQVVVPASCYAGNGNPDYSAMR